MTRSTRFDILKLAAPAARPPPHTLQAGHALVQRWTCTLFPAAWQQSAYWTSAPALYLVGS